MNPDGSNQRKLTKNIGYESIRAIRPNLDYLLIRSAREDLDGDGKPDISDYRYTYLINSKGEDIAKLDLGGEFFEVVLSPDGKFIAHVKVGGWNRINIYLTKVEIK